MKIIDKLLNRLGYYRCDWPKGSEVSEAQILEMFGAYGDNKIFVRFLRDMCAQDRRLYFQASSDRDRHTLRGAHDRCNYFIALIHKAHARRKRN